MSKSIPSARSFCHLGCILLVVGQSAQAGQFLCAQALPEPRAKVVGDAQGTVQALVLFADFADGTREALPAWADWLFAAKRPGSLRHFYDTMSGGRLQLAGEVVPRLYRSADPARAYAGEKATELGGFGDFSLEILTQADAHIDWSQYDSDGPDGRPNSGDDDGFVDAVFIVVDKVPAGFIRGPATGAGGLGLKDDFITGDMGASGSPVRIHSRRGTIQQGRSFNEAVGAMAHEYGHVLGLPDLFNVAWLQSEEADPEEDSAGIGKWGLMGWGALGWRGDDGPTSFSAWSRRQLGWADVVEPRAAQSTLRLQEVGRSGQMGLIYLGRQSQFLLLEYRTPKSTYYDRHIPAAGLLLWHVDRRLGEGVPKVDLECADGRWVEGGFPLGREAAPQSGGDNLDFWAHDAGYAGRHQGNLGDATDPFDGERFTAFNSTTNPSAHSNDGQVAVDLGAMRLEGDWASLVVSVPPARVRINQIGTPYHQVVSGREMALSFNLENSGGLKATDLVARLSSDTREVEIINGQLPLSDLAALSQAFNGGVGEQGFPRLRFAADLAAPAEATLRLEIYAAGVLVDWAVVQVKGVPSVLLSGTVRDTEGNPLAGIPVHLNASTLPGVVAPVAGGLDYPSEVATGPDGRYQVRLPPGTFDVWASPLESQPWGGDVYHRLSVNQDRVADFVLPRVFLLQGVVYGPGGEPVGDIEVRADSGSRAYSSWTHTDGTYYLKVPAGLYNIGTGTKGIGRANYAPARLEAVQISADRELDLQLQEGVSLVVQVVGGRGEAVARVALALVGAAGQWEQVAETDAAGLARINLPVGPHILRAVEVPVPYLPDGQLHLAVQADTTAVFELARGVVVEGRLQSGDGGDFPGAGMTWSRLDGTASRHIFVFSSAGRYALALLPGRYRVEVDFFRGAWPSQILGQVEVGGAGLVRDFTLRPGVQLSGRVTTADGRGLGGSVRLHSPDDGVELIGFMQAGEYALNALPGEYRARVFIEPPDDRVWIGWTWLWLGPVQLVGDLRMDWSVPPLVPFSGQVLGASDLIRAQSLHVRLEGETASGWVQPDFSGHFGLEVPQGIYRVQLVHSGRAGSSRWLAGQVGGAHMKGLVFHWPEGRLQGKLLVEGQAGLEVFALTEPERLHALGAGLAAAQAAATAEGSYQLFVRPGTYALAAYAQPLPDGQQRGRVIAGVQLPAGNTLRQIDLAARDGGHQLRGSVERVGLDREDLVRLQFYAPASGVALQVTNSGQDHYAVDLSAGRYVVEAGQWRDDRLVRAWRVGRVEIDGPSTWNVRLDPGATAVEERVAPQPRFALEQNYPNPFNGTSVIPFAVGGAGPVSLAIYNAVGQRLRHMQWVVPAAGRYQFVWQGRTDGGQRVSSGVYFYRLQAGSRVSTRRLVLVQ